jgi:hypothetical protein
MVHPLLGYIHKYLALGSFIMIVMHLHYDVRLQLSSDGKDIYEANQIALGSSAYDLILNIYLLSSPLSKQLKK